MPFEIQADGPYFNVLDFFGRLSRLSRIINVGDLKLQGLATKASSTNFHMASGSSVTGTMTITTFFSKAADAGSASTTSTTTTPPAGAPAKR